MSLTDLGVCGVGRTPSAYQMARSFTKFSVMLDTFIAVRLMIARLKRSVYNVTIGADTYTIGTGGTWNGFRPEDIERMGFIYASSSPSQELPIHVDTDEEWADTSVKALTGTIPTNAWYDRDYPLGIIHLWPVPQQTGQVAIYVPTPITSPVTIDDDLSVPPGYLSMYNTNLNLAIAPMFRRPIDEDMRRAANNSLKIVATANTKASRLVIPEAAKSGRFRTGRYNIITDTYGGK